MLITLVTLATVCFTLQSYAQGTLPGEPSLPPAGWTGVWPPMPSPDYGYVPPLRPPQYPFPSPPPIYGVGLTTAGLTPTPEPATYSLLLLGTVAGWLVKRRRG